MDIWTFDNWTLDNWTLQIYDLFELWYFISLQLLDVWTYKLSKSSVVHSLEVQVSRSSDVQKFSFSELRCPEFQLSKAQKFRCPDSISSVVQSSVVNKVQLSTKFSCQQSSVFQSSDIQNFSVESSEVQMSRLQKFNCQQSSVFQSSDVISVVETRKLRLQQFSFQKVQFSKVQLSSVQLSSCL